MRKLLNHLKKLERQNYPEFMQYMQDIDNWEEFCEYCECDNPVVHSTDGSCLIMTHSEIVDLVATPQDIFRIYKWVREHFGNRIIEGDFRYNTSYPIIKLFEKRKKINILSETKWYWEHERMIEIKFQIT